MGAHVVVDRRKLGHRNPQEETKEFAGGTRRRERWDGEEGCTKGLAGWQEDVSQAQVRPADRTSRCREFDGLTLNAPTEPVEKLFLLASDQYRIASDPDRSDDGLVRVQFTGKPAGRATEGPRL